MGWILFAGLLGWVVGGAMGIASCKSEIVKTGRLSISGRAWRCTEVKDFGA